MKDKLKVKQAEVKEQFETLDSQRETMVKQRAELDRQIASIAKEQVLLQGSFRTLEELMKDGDKPTPTIPKKKK